MDASCCLCRVLIGVSFTVCLVQPASAQLPISGNRLHREDRAGSPVVQKGVQEGVDAPKPFQSAVSSSPSLRATGENHVDAAPLPDALFASATADVPEVMPVDLSTALELTLSRNPDLVAIRQHLPVSSAAIAVARRFPTSLNPTVSVDVRPWVFERGGTPVEADVTISWNQPIQLGRRQAYRETIARAAFSQTQWTIVHAELSALVQTYRLHQTATYRRERLRVAQELADFNAALVEAVRRQMQANRASVADASMAEVENQSTIQQWAASRQEFVAALAELRQQMGIPEYAGNLEPSGPLEAPKPFLPADEDRLIHIALASRPEIQAAAAQAASSRAAVCLARADRIPIPSVGPVYERDESGVSFYGIVASTPVPLLNAGGPLLRQREAEYHRDMVALEQLRERVRAQVKASLVKWNQVQQLVARTQATMGPIQAETARMERLYNAGQTDLIRLLQVRGRLIQAENARLDALWQATQAYADLLAVLGCSPLIGSTATDSDHPGVTVHSPGTG